MTPSRGYTSGLPGPDTVEFHIKSRRGTCLAEAGGLLGLQEPPPWVGRSNGPSVMWAVGRSLGRNGIGHVWRAGAGKIHCRSIRGGRATCPRSEGVPTFGFGISTPHRERSASDEMSVPRQTLTQRARPSPARPAPDRRIRLRRGISCRFACSFESTSPSSVSRPFRSNMRAPFRPDLGPCALTSSRAAVRAADGRPSTLRAPGGRRKCVCVCVGVGI